ncbi:hypothetical protein A1F97_10845, partial [Pyrenophora tritici-repentis]
SKRASIPTGTTTRTRSVRRRSGCRRIIRGRGKERCASYARMRILLRGRVCARRKRRIARMRTSIA